MSYDIGISVSVNRGEVTEDDIKHTPTCCICLDDFILNDNVYELDCKHQFHVHCLIDWLKVKIQCPYCRTDIDFSYVLLIILPPSV